MKYLNFYKILDKYFESRKKKKMDIIIENFSKNNIDQTKMLDDENFVLSVVKNVDKKNVRDFSDINALSYMSKRLKDNKDFMLEIININGLYLQFASNSLRNDKDVVLEAVIKNKHALEYASDRLKDNNHIVREAIKKDGLALEYVSARLKDDYEIVFEAVKQVQVSNTLEYASERLKNDKDFMLEVVNIKGSTLRLASQRLKDDKEVVLIAVKNNFYSLYYASENLQNDKELLEILEKTTPDTIAEYSCEDWYNARMEVLANIREKEIMEKSIIENTLKPKKIKF